MSYLRPAITLTLLFTVLTGVAYPLVVTGAGQLIFPQQSHGSLIERDGKVLGSELIAQPFTEARYFHPRPSAAGEGFDAAASSGSNLGPTSKKLIADITARSADTSKANPNAGAKIPLDLVTTSGSGLDPHISPAAAQFQIARVAAARGLDPQSLETLVADVSEPRTLGFIGEPRVNVLLLNLALDKLQQP